MGIDLLKLAGEFARADQDSKAERIREAGEDIQEKSGIKNMCKKVIIVIHICWIKLTKTM